MKVIGYQKITITLQNIIKNSEVHSALTITVILTVSSILIKAKLLSKSKILLGFNTLKPVMIDLSKPRHIVIFGMTGSGKTETAKKIVHSTKRRKLIVDWAGEYFYGKVATPQELNLKLTPHEIIDSISSAFQLTIPQQAFLLEAAKGTETLTEIIRKMKKMKTNETEREIRNALLRRLLPLEEMGLFTGTLSLSEIDTLDLSKLTYEAKKLTINIALRMFYNSPEPRILVIEEAQNVIPTRQLSQTPTTAELIINELRKRGVSVILIAQMPSQVSLAFRNADYIIVHRLQLTVKEAQTLGLSNNEVKKIAKLETGECLIISKGEKIWIKVLRRKNKQGKKPHRTREKTKAEKHHQEKDYPYIEEIIEEISLISKWKTETSNKINRIEEILSKITQDLRELNDAWEAIKKARIAINPISIGDFIKRTDKRLTQLSTAIAVLRRKQLEKNLKTNFRMTNHDQTNMNEIKSEIIEIKKKITNLERSTKQNIRKIYGVADKLQKLQGSLIEFERWVKEVFNNIE